MGSRRPAFGGPRSGLPDSDRHLLRVSSIAERTDRQRCRAGIGGFFLSLDIWIAVSAGWLRRRPFLQAYSDSGEPGGLERGLRALRVGPYGLGTGGASGVIGRGAGGLYAHGAGSCRRCTRRGDAGQGFRTLPGGILRRHLPGGLARGGGGHPLGVAPKARSLPQALALTRCRTVAALAPVRL